MAVDGFILEEDNVTNLRDQTLFLPSESPSCIFLLPKGVVELEDNSPPGDLMWN